MKPFSISAFLISRGSIQGLATALIVAGTGSVGCTPATQDSGGLSSATPRSKVTLCSDCSDEDDEGETPASEVSPSSSPSPTESTSPSTTTSVTKDCPEGEYIYDLYLKSDAQGITDIGFKCATEELALRKPYKSGLGKSLVALRSRAVLKSTDQNRAGIRLIADGSDTPIVRPGTGGRVTAVKSWLIGQSVSDSQTTVHTGSGSDDKITSISFLYRRSRFCGVDSLAAQESLTLSSVDSCSSLMSIASDQNTYYSVGCETGQLIGGFKAELDDEGHITSINARTWILGFAGWTPSDCETTLTEAFEL